MPVNTQEETQCEQKDWEWQKFKSDTTMNGSGLTSPASVTLNKLINETRIGVAIIGLGRMGQIHLRNLIREPKANLLYCFDSSQKVLDNLAKTMFFEEYGIKALLSDQFDLALEDPRVKAIIIVTPHHLHEFYARKALEASKSVMCEKPLTLVSANVKPLFDLARENRVFLMCAFNRRYDPDFRYIHERLHHDEALGSLHLVKISSRDAQTPPMSYVRISGDLFHDSTIHDFDHALWYIKELPCRIQLMGKTWKEHYASNPDQLELLSQEDRKILKDEINDFYTVNVSLKFPSGAIAIIDNSRQSCYGYDIRCEAYGLKGMMKCDGKHSLNVTHHDSGVKAESPLNYAFASRFSTAYANELQDILTMSQLARTDFYDQREVLKKYLQEPPKPTLILASLKVADAAVEAWKKDGPVELEWSDEFRQQFAMEMA